MSSNSPEFSFDLNPDLDIDLDEAYQRNVAMGIAEPIEVAPEGLVKAVEDVIGQQVDSEVRYGNMAREAMLLAVSELTPAFDSWKKYDGLLDQKVPNSISELFDLQPNLEPIVDRLYKAKVDLTRDGKTTPEDWNLGNSMHLRLIPWRTIRNHLQDFPDWIKSMRTKQGLVTKADFFNKDLAAQIRTNLDLYRDRFRPDIQQSVIGYVEMRIAEQGEWGVMLAQTSGQAGIKDWIGTSPDDLTNHGQTRPLIAGHEVDAMGIFEWIALTFQEDPRQLSSNDFSWLLANRMNANNTACVPYGYFYGGQVRSYLNDAVYTGSGARPRLAVM